MTRTPTLRVERALLREGARLLAGMDEVGRGALCGPVTVGVCLVADSTPTAPRGLRDSKLLTPEARERLAPRIERWAVGSAVGHASAAEIDTWGILRALRLAGLRALAALPAAPDLVLLDGSYDWLADRGDDVLFGPGQGEALPEAPPVLTRVKADLACASVAGASVLAKTCRDALMERLDDEHPGYGWRENRGYATPGHIEALARLGASGEHRRSWSLPGLARGDLDAGGVGRDAQECLP